MSGRLVFRPGLRPLNASIFSTRVGILGNNTIDRQVAGCRFKKLTFVESHVMRLQVTKRERNKHSQVEQCTDFGADSGGRGRVVKVGGRFLGERRAVNKSR